MSLSRVRWEVWTSHTLFSSFIFTTQAKKHSFIHFINFYIGLLYPNTFYNKHSRNSWYQCFKLYKWEKKCSASLKCACSARTTYSTSEWLESLMERGMRHASKIHSWFRFPTLSCNDLTALVLDCNPDIWHELDWSSIRLTFKETLCCFMEKIAKQTPPSSVFLAKTEEETESSIHKKWIVAESIISYMLNEL